MAQRKTTHSQRIEAEIQSLAAQVRWFIGVGIAIFAIIAGFLVLKPDPVAGALEEIRLLNRGYEPVFRSVMMDRAYDLLSDVHITEIQDQGELNRNLREIKESLATVRAFEDRNQGLLQIFGLLEAMANGGDETVEGAFLSTHPLKDLSLNMTPQEAGFFITFQGLLYLDRMRAADSDAEFRKYLELAFEKLMEANRLNTGIANMWNGLGILYIDMAHLDGNLALIEKARHAFQIAYELHRSPINLAAKINNHAYVTMLAAFHETIVITPDPDSGAVTLVVKNTAVTQAQFSRMINLLQHFETALTYDPSSLSIMLSKAEVLCTISLYSQFGERSGISDGVEISSSVVEVVDDEFLQSAMEVVREAHIKGFSDWEYLFSRVWVAATLLRVEKYRKELVSFVEH